MYVKISEVNNFKKKIKNQIFSGAWIVFNPRFSNLATGQTPKKSISTRMLSSSIYWGWKTFRVSRRVRHPHFGCLRVKPISVPLESQTHPEAISKRCCTSTPAQTELKLIHRSATGVTFIKPCEALKYFTDMIRTSRSKSIALLLQPRSHKGSPDGSTGQNLIYFILTQVHNLAWCIFAGPLSPVRIQLTDFRKLL